MFITLSSDYLYVLAMLKTTPLVVTVGLSLTIPLAVIGDFFLHKAAPLQVLFGAALVVLSFFLVGFMGQEQQEQEKTTRTVIREGFGAEEEPDVPLQDENGEDRRTR
jgi:solute carrier family 35, member F5